MRRPRPCGVTFSIGVRSGLCRQRAEDAVEERLQGLGVDIADDRDLEIGPRQHAMRIGFEIVDADARQRFRGAVHRPAIGMPLVSGFPPAAACDIARARRLAPQHRHDLRAVEFDIRGVETRRGKRKPQQVERLVAIFRQGAHRAADIVAFGAEIHFDGFALEPVLESLGIEIAGAGIEQRCGEIGGARLAGRILDRAADEGEVDGDQRHRRLVHQPGLDAAGTRRRVRSWSRSPAAPPRVRRRAARSPAPHDE